MGHPSRHHAFSINIISAPATGGKNLKNVLLLLTVEYSIL
jgi:hypothetical protein